MKDLTAFELSILVKELALLTKAKLDKIYHPAEKEFLLRFHVKDHGKKLLRILLPNALFLTELKQDYPAPSAFCMFLRKRIQGSRLLTIQQKHGERILELFFQGRENHLVILEFFGAGNLIVCKENYEIISALESHVWKTRAIKKGETYKYPQQSFSFLDITFESFLDLLKKTNRESIVKTLAMDLGLGGLYAEEACFLANIDKTRKRLNEEEKKALFKCIQSLTKKKTEPVAVIKDEKIVNILPFPLSHKKSETKSFKKFTEALDALFTKKITAEQQTTYTKKIKKLNTILKKQEQAVKKLEKQQQENKEKAELLYQHYQLIDEILTELKKVRKKHSWKEIKEKLKGHKIIKEINAKDGTITLEL